MKKVLSVSLAALVAAAMFLASCNSLCKKESCKVSCCTSQVNGDSLMALWNEAWNTHNLEAFKNMIADDAVVIEKEWKVISKDSIINNWISKSLPDISNVKTETIKECNCTCCVSLTGFYSLDVKTEKGTEIEKGNYTFIWNKEKDNSWKLKVIHLGIFPSTGQ